ncbi:MAG: hypothetical protein P1U68_08675 [Verrucomicrobiales bacterium]|nr:hypothetical protein [Verrucomicrobiales bacterium]
MSLIPHSEPNRRHHFALSVVRQSSLAWRLKAPESNLPFYLGSPPKKRPVSQQLLLQGFPEFNLISQLVSEGSQQFGSEQDIFYPKIVGVKSALGKSALILIKQHGTGFRPFEN